jgi:hypothetical protein
MKLKAPVTDENDQTTGPQASDLKVWHAMQDLIKERMEVPIRMPEWEEIVIEKIRVDRFAIPHVPALREKAKGTRTPVNHLCSPACCEALEGLEGQKTRFDTKRCRVRACLLV